MLNKPSFQFCTRTLYQILGVPNNATQEQIKEAYLKLAKVHHPDVSQNDTQDFKIISNAYNALKDPTQRSIYDQNFQNKPKQQYRQPYQQKAYRNPEQNDVQRENSSSSWLWILAGGTIILYYWNTIPKNVSRIQDPPGEKQIRQNKQLEQEVQNLTNQVKKETDYIKLQELYDKLNRIQTQQQPIIKVPVPLYTQQNTQIRRQNVILSGENINDSPEVIQKRKTILQEEMNSKQFKIQQETWEYVTKGNVRSLRRKSPNIQPKLKSQGLDDYAHEHKLEVFKADTEYKAPIQLTIEQIDYI